MSPSQKMDNKMKKIFGFAVGMALSCNMIAQDLITAPTLKDISSALNNKSNDFGMLLSFDVEKKLAPGFSFDIEGELRTQDDSKEVERVMIGAGLSYRLFQTDDKRFNLKAGLGFQYMWRQSLAETTRFDKIGEHYTELMNDEGIMEEMIDGYTQRSGLKYADSYWRNRHRTSLSLAGTFSPSKRWSFSLKETLQFTHYCSTDSIPRTRHNETYYKWRESGEFNDAGYPLYYDANQWAINGDGDFYNNPECKVVPFDDIDNKRPRNSKDRLVLRSKFTAKYNVRGLPLNPYASVDYGVGLNYTTNKWKFSVGTEYKLSKHHKLDFYYRFSHEDDEDEPNGHLVGIGYKLDL